MRSYIRHPADIPINVDTATILHKTAHTRTTNVSNGGLAFDSNEIIPQGSLIRLRISVVRPEFEAEGVVTHCDMEGDHFVVGVQFIHHDDLYVARMVEQICHIEHYKREVAEREGRWLSGQEAALEWIEKYAGQFPTLDN